jgi:Zn-finger nucleic acid-binding protein
MAGASGHCPGCNVELTRGDMRGIGVRVCTQCRGALVAQIDMFRLFEAMIADLLSGFDPDTLLTPITPRTGASSCPECASAMSRDDYCGAGLVRFDRCERCRLLWLGADELGTMMLMWARMEKQIARTQKQNQQWLDDADFVFHATLLGRRAGAIMFHALGL